MAAPPKLHHYIPQVYLRPFSNPSGKVITYRKDDPRNPHPRSTREVGAQNNYYAQPKPDGSLDRGLETFFQTNENLWSSILDDFETSGQLSSDLVEPFFQFMGGLKVRGPVSRDAAELAYAEQVRAAGEIMERLGDFPPPPEGFEDTLRMKNLVLKVDPHQSIHAMPAMLNAFARVLEYLGFALVRNRTTTSLLTSDNPVVYFDPSVPEDQLRPYAIERGPPIELLFPLTPRLLIVGSSDWVGPRAHSQMRQLTCDTPSMIRRVNRYVARFAYREVYAADRTHDALVSKWANESPIVRNTIVAVPDGNLTISQWVFGARPTKPKWKAN